LYRAGGPGDKPPGTFSFAKAGGFSRAAAPSGPIPSCSERKGLVRRLLAASLIATLAVAGCGSGDDAGAGTRAPTSTTSPRPPGPLEVFGIDRADRLLSWSTVPQRDVVLYAEEIAPRTASLVTFDTGGAVFVLAASLTTAATVTVDPVGERVVVVEPAAGRGWVMWSVPIAGGDRTVLDESPVPIAPDAFTSDGSEILYRKLGERPELRVAALDGTGSRLLAQTTFGLADPVMGAATIVGERAVYATADGTENVELWSIEVDGGGLTRIPLTTDLKTVWRIGGAADGRHALVEATVAGGAGSRSLYAAWADGRGPAVLLDDGAADPAGVAEVRGEADEAVYRVGDEWYATHLSGTGRQRLYDAEVEVPGFAWVDEAVLLDDGSWVFSSSQETGKRELYHLDEAGGEVTKLSGELPSHRGVLGGEETDSVLEFAPLGDGGHVAYTTGLDGENTDITYRLFIAALP
jgi:hypothetical protein